MSLDLDPEQIAQLPLSFLETYAAGHPPPGIIPNFDNPPTLVPAILGSGTAFLAPALLLYSIRIYTKVFVIKKLSWDDLTCTLGFSFAIAYYSSLVIGCVHGSIGRHMWDIYLIRLVNQYSLAELYITTTTNPPALGFIKLTLFIQYYSFFSPFRWVQRSVWIGSITSGLFYLVVSIAAFVLNSPWPGETLLEAVLSQRYETFARFSIPIGVIGMLVDIYLLVLPIRAVAKLHLRPSRKIGLSILFGTGALASVSSIVGLAYRVIVQHSMNDQGWKVSYLHIFGQIEMFSGVACACMPIASKFWSVYQPKQNSLKQSSLNLLLKTMNIHSGSKDQTEELHPLPRPSVKVDVELFREHISKPKEVALESDLGTH